MWCNICHKSKQIILLIRTYLFVQGDGKRMWLQAYTRNKHVTLLKFRDQCCSDSINLCFYLKSTADVAVCLPGFFCTFTLFSIVSFVLNEHHGLALLSEGGGGLFHCNYLCRVRAGGRLHGLLPCSLGLLYRPANIQRYLKDRNVRDGWLPWFCYNIRLYLHYTVTAA